MGTVSRHINRFEVAIALTEAPINVIIWDEPITGIRGRDNTVGGVGGLMLVSAETYYTPKQRSISVLQENH